LDVFAAIALAVIIINVVNRFYKCKWKFVK
jgi:ABC-type long-subunit fatty acid transport system fused permease/ATPase subunit